jgi:ATP-dependent DNA ligase
VPEGNGFLGALHLARKEGHELAYDGRVGTGWSMKQSAELRQRLEAMEVERSAVTWAATKDRMGEADRESHCRVPDDHNRRPSSTCCLEGSEVAP